MADFVERPLAQRVGALLRETQRDADALVVAIRPQNALGFQKIEEIRHTTDSVASELFELTTFVHVRRGQFSPDEARAMSSLIDYGGPLLDCSAIFRELRGLATDTVLPPALLPDVNDPAVYLKPELQHHLEQIISQDREIAENRAQRFSSRVIHLLEMLNQKRLSIRAAMREPPRDDAGMLYRIGFPIPLPDLSLPDLSLPDLSLPGLRHVKLMLVELKRIALNLSPIDLVIVLLVAALALSMISK